MVKTLEANSYSACGTTGLEIPREVHLFERRKEAEVKVIHKDG